MSDLSPSEIQDLGLLLATYRGAAAGTMAIANAHAQIVRWIEHTIEGRSESWHQQINHLIGDLI